VAGIAARTKARLGARAPITVAVSAENAAVMLASLRAGRPVDVPEQVTLASALAGGIGPDNRHSFALVRDLVDEHAVVSERAIADAMRHLIERSNLVVEGGGAVAVAALLSEAWREPDVGPERGAAAGPIVIVLSGGNVATETLLGVLAARTGG
jgi:threonine dehydratase